MKKGQFKNPIVNIIANVISWTMFAILALIGIFLLYYVFSASIYASKGQKYEPPVSLYTIVSGSMIPNIDVYDVVVNFKVNKPQDIKKNDVITFTSTSTISYGVTVTHRVIDIKIDENGKYSYRTKGDNNLTADEAYVPYENVIGKVVLKLPQVGRVQFLLLKAGGWLFAILIPAVGVVIYDIMKVLNLTSTKKKVDEVSSKNYEEKLSEEKSEELKKEIKNRLKNKDIDFDNNEENNKNPQEKNNQKKKKNNENYTGDFYDKKNDMPKKKKNKKK